MFPSTVITLSQVLASIAERPTNTGGRRRATLLLGMCIAGTVAPAMLNLGYSVVDSECLALFGLSVLLGFALALPVSRWNGAAALAGTIILTSAIDLYALDIFDPAGFWLLVTLCGVVCWGLRAKIIPILAVGTTAFTVATAVTTDSGWESPLPHNYPGQPGPPTLIHVILDEHGGPGGLPKEIFDAQEIQKGITAYSDGGFRVYDSIQVGDGHTEKSLAATLNLDVPTTVTLVRGRDIHRLRRNAYFKELRARGYRIGVVQSSFLNVCPADLTAGITCRTYPHHTAAAMRSADLAWHDRLTIFVGLLDRSMSSEYPGYLYSRLATPATARAGKIDAWRIQPLVAMHLLPQVENELRLSGRGEVLFVHLLLPHYPYAYDSACRLKPVSQWLERTGQGGSVTLEGRQQRYIAYRAQQSCADTRMQRLVQIASENRALSDATFIVHGDHGSRIAPAPYRDIGSGYDSEDHARDWLTTLFAVRRPGLSAGLDERQHSLDRLLWETVGLVPEGQKIQPDQSRGATERD